MNDCGVGTFNVIICIPCLRKNLISFDTLQENGFVYRYDGDNGITKVNKGALALKREKRITCNIYKLVYNSVVGDIVSTEFDNYAIKLRHMHHSHLSECKIMKLHKRNLLKSFQSFNMNFFRYYELRNIVVFDLRLGEKRVNA